ncbi:MAG: cobalt chelatase, partial [Verrucomicrobia bacterium]|nr:cobalt chelatase [Verrucomicrobiota bacterium]
MRVDAASEGIGGAMVRTITGNPNLQWTGRTLYDGVEPVALRSAHHQDIADTWPAQRGLLDGAALRLLYSDCSLHDLHAPTDETELFIFELLEQLRVESLAPSTLPGLRGNLRKHFLQWAEDFMNSGLTETGLGILLFTIAGMSWSRLNGHEVSDRMGDLMEATRANISPALGADLAGLKAHADCQAQFIPYALAISRWVSETFKTAQADAAGQQKPFKSRNHFVLRLTTPRDQFPTPPVAISGESASWQASHQRYRVFTKTYDAESHAMDLIRFAERSEIRQQMDIELAELRLNIPRLARLLKSRLSCPSQNTWIFGLEHGFIDASRLAQIVSDPSQRDIFKAERQVADVDAAVTLLIDCSGSMKAHANALSLLIDTLGRALDTAGIPTEILGFSTRSWNGGRAQRDWQRAGRPPLPGRLNEIQHLIFKASHEVWRRGRQGLAGLRKFDLFREGIDGEALQWAAQRLLALPVSRKILVVIS